MSSVREVVLPPPGSYEPARHVRSTIVLSSLGSIREAGLGEAYLAAMPAGPRDLVLSSVVGMWIPMDAAIAHYTALDSLNLSADEQVAFGRATFNKTAGTLLGTAVRLSRSAGVTPWSVFPLFQRFWHRGVDGGAIVIHKLGPKDAQIDILDVPVNDVRYFRNGLRGLCMGLLDMFCARSYVREVAGARAPGALHVRAQWA